MVVGPSGREQLENWQRTVDRGGASEGAGGRAGLVGGGCQPFEHQPDRCYVHTHISALQLRHDDVRVVGCG